MRTVIAKRIALMVAVGLAVGALTVGGQLVLPGSWNHFANSGAVWLLAAFFVGAAMPSYRWAAPAGVLTLFGALAGYILTAAALGFAYTLSATLFWGAIAIVGGPLYGAAGLAWRSDVLRQRVIGVALLGAVFMAEGWYTLQYNQNPQAGWASIAIGLFLAVLLSRWAKETLYVLLAMLPITALGMGAFALLAVAT